MADDWREFDLDDVLDDFDDQHGRRAGPQPEPAPSVRRRWPGHPNLDAAIEAHRIAEIECVASMTRRRSKIRACASWLEWS